MADTGANDDSDSRTKFYGVAALLIAGASLCLMAQGVAAHFRLYPGGGFFVLGVPGLCLAGLIEYVGRTTVRRWRR